MVNRTTQIGKAYTGIEFALPTWEEQDADWRQIDRRIADDHLARRIDEGVDRLHLEALFGSYQGRGSPPLRPDLMLKVVMYEIAVGRPSPAEWFRDTRDSDTVKWLGFGIQPSRTTCYEFWERVAPYFDGWNEEVLQSATEEGFTSARRVAQDGTTVAANASRHKLVNQETLQRRIGELDEVITADEQGRSSEKLRSWMAKHADTRQTQRAGYERAAERMDMLQAENQKRRACKRRPAEKIVLSVSDPEAACGRDKLNVFRPLYNVQLQYDLDSPFILGYDVFNRATDTGTLPPMLERTSELIGRKPAVILADSTYATILDLEVCQQHQIMLYAPVNENDYSGKNHRKPQTNQFTQLPKAEFTWLEDEATFICPEGHRLEREHTSWVRRLGGQKLRNMRFRCPPEHCRVCPRGVECTPTLDKGRTVSRMENEELLDELRERMKTEQAKLLYRLRGQTVELAFADMKEHRSLRRLSGRGLRKAKAQVAALVLAHNLLTLSKEENRHETGSRPIRTLEKIA
jgi:transposase